MKIEHQKLEAEHILELSRLQVQNKKLEVERYRLNLIKRFPLAGSELS